jgi:hypothetical protein
MKSPKKKTYLNDFKMNEAGKYEYQGKHYVFSGGESEQKAAYRKLWIMFAALAVMIIGSGFITAGGMSNTFYVIIPYIGELCALFALGWNHFKLLTKGEEIRSYVFLQANPKIPVAAVICAFFGAVSLIMSVVYTIIAGFEGGALMCIAYWLIKALVTACALIYRNYYINLEWVEI